MHVAPDLMTTRFELDSKSYVRPQKCNVRHDLNSASFVQPQQCKLAVYNIFIEVRHKHNNVS